jgi:hypothetical protein
MAINDPVVQSSVRAKEEAGVQTVVSVRGKISGYTLDCPFSQCALITIREVNSHATLAVMLNTEKATVVQIKGVDGW